MATIKKELATKPSKERSGLYEIRLGISIARGYVFRVRTGIPWLGTIYLLTPSILREN